MAFQALRRFAPVGRAVNHIRRRLWRGGVRPAQGLPPALAFETLDALCRERGMGGLRQCAHSHLSSWKTFGTYHIKLLTESGAHWSLIFKNECYRSDVIPALEGLPVSPGLPEALIYRIGSGVLSPFLPQLIWFREIEPHHHFQYLLEDLVETHVRLGRDLADYMRVAYGLVRMQRALKETFAGNCPDSLLNYDRCYSERLLAYAAANFRKYVSQTGDGAIEALLNRWRDVEFEHQRDEFYHDSQRNMIHGDFNRSNIYVDRANRTQLKVGDWEWAGRGLPHADLAALAKPLCKEHQLALLQVFINDDERLDPEQHRRMFYWCQLERRLLDAAFLARQQMLSARRVQWAPAAIRRAAKDIIFTVESLQAPVTPSRSRKLLSRWSPL